MIARHDPPMLLDPTDSPWPLLYRGPDADEFTDEHEGYVAARDLDGQLTDIWTDATTLPTATAYQARCDCGWVGAAYPADAGGYHACQHSWATQHLVPYLMARRAMGAAAH